MYFYFAFVCDYLLSSFSVLSSSIQSPAACRRYFSAIFRYYSLILSVFEEVDELRFYIDHCLILIICTFLGKIENITQQKNSIQKREREWEIYMKVQLISSRMGKQKDQSKQITP